MTECDLESQGRKEGWCREDPEARVFMMPRGVGEGIRGLGRWSAQPGEDR